MASTKRSILSRLKLRSLRTILGANRRLLGEDSEQRLQAWLLRNNEAEPYKLMRLGRGAEDAGDLMLAVMAWHKLCKLTVGEEGIKDPHPLFARAVRKYASLETKLRWRLIGAGAITNEQLWPQGLILPITYDTQMKKAVSPYIQKTRAEFLSDLWANQIGALSEDHQTALRLAYALQIKPLLKQELFDYALSALQPLLALWPDYQSGQRLYHRVLLERLVVNPEEERGALEGWWQYFDANREIFERKTLSQIWDESALAASRLIAEGRIKEAEWLARGVMREQPDHGRTLGVLAELAADEIDWRRSADHWQLMAAVSNPITTKSRSHVAQNVKTMQRRTTYARNQLREARIRLAGELRDAGRRRESDELISRIVEMLPDQRVMKKEAELVDLLRRYVQDAMCDDGVTHRPGTGSKPRRIAICLDVLKISDVHTHSRVVYSICRNLMEMDPDIETHVIVTNERLAVTTPVLATSFNPVYEAAMESGAREALPEFYDTRFFLHVYRNTGLEGLVSTCKSILEINPDVILYGGGHRGLFSNESRVVRHCLYDHFPSAFFYIQANNQVDDKLDMIIARGPHEIEGDRGAAVVRVQPYPTINAEGFVNEVPIDMEKYAGKAIISAITSVRMDVQMAETDPADMTEMMSILDQVPGTVWHLIGASQPEKVIKTNPQIAERVAAGQMVVHPVLPFEEFTNLVSNAALFFHMPGLTGGSGGATVARRGGIPIVTFEHSDVSGRQPPQTVFANDNLTGAVDLSVQLLKNGDLWRSTVEAQFAHTNWIRETSAAGFYDCLAETVQHYRRRQDPNAATVPDQHISPPEV